MRSAADGAQALAEALRAHGGTIAEVVEEAPSGSIVGQDRPGPAQRAASGPRADGREREYELLVEMILEGSRLHYGAGRVIATDDADLRLLLGDQLYALGLSRLAELGDLLAVSELGDLISLVAQAQAADDEGLVEALWAASATAVGWGATPDHERAKELARKADPGAVAALRRAAVALGS